MTPEEVVVIIRRSTWLLLGGFLAFIYGLFTDSYITMTGMLAVMVGACARGVGSGVHVRGMWFVAALMWLLTVFIYAAMSYLQVWHLMQHQADIVPFISLTVATWLLGLQSRFLLAMAILNRRWPRE